MKSATRHPVPPRSQPQVSTNPASKSTATAAKWPEATKPAPTTEPEPKPAPTKPPSHPNRDGDTNPKAGP
jgi:hypothetical protein